MNIRQVFIMLAALLVSCAMLNAQDRDTYRHDEYHDHADEHRHFTDHDRHVLQDWYRDHADRFESGDHGDRWNNEDLERNLQVDRVFDEHMRRWAHPVPEELESRMDPLPRDWHYMMIGYNVCIVDRDWTIRDIFHFDQFNDHDREVIRDWNRDHPDALKGFLGGFGIHIDNGDLDRRIQVGVIVDPDLRQRSHPAPEDLVSRLSPTPRDWHYVIIGDRLCLVDPDWRVHESFHFQH